MPEGILTEPISLPRRRKKASSGHRQYSLDASGNARVEFVVPPEWLARLDELADSLGLGRSACIRLACTMYMDSMRPPKPKH